jgi:hypothetical protein
MPRLGIGVAAPIALGSTNVSVTSGAVRDSGAAEYFRSTQHMLLVQMTEPVHEGTPLGERLASGKPFWVCGHCHAPREKILRVVKRAGQVA